VGITERYNRRTNRTSSTAAVEQTYPQIHKIVNKDKDSSASCEEKFLAFLFCGGGPSEREKKLNDLVVGRGLFSFHSNGGKVMARARAIN